MAKKKYNNKDKARKFRSMRPAVGENYMYDFSQPSNTQSTHLAQSYGADGKYYAIPSITNFTVLSFASTFIELIL